MASGAPRVTRASLVCATELGPDVARHDLQSNSWPCNRRSSSPHTVQSVFVARSSPVASPSMVATTIGDETVIEALRKKLESGRLTLPQKYRVLCSLRNCSNASALDALLVALRDDSALYRHDIAFALGQRQDAAAVEALKQILADEAEHCMVRHEAAEALGAIGTPECMQPLQRNNDNSVREVAETCVLASQRMDYFAHLPDAEQASKFQSVDPTPPFPSSTPCEELAQTLLDESTKLFDRYRSLFALRNQGGTAAVAAIIACLRSSSSALLKHEIAYVLGQMLDKASVDCLKDALQDTSEHAMVRHEAAEALGAIGDGACVRMLEEYASDADAIVADSCIVALDMIAHERSGAFEYADMGHS